MAVDEELWWSVWWEWVVVWVVTALALAVVVGVVVVTVRSARRTRLRRLPGVPFQLDGPAVLRIIAANRHEGRTMSKEVIARAVLTKDGKIGIPWLSGTGGAVTATQERTTTYQETYEPIDLIGSLLDELEDNDDLVHLDLRKRQLLRNAALERQLQSSDASEGFRFLEEVDAYVSVKGGFRVAAETNGTTVFLAPFGRPTDPGDGPQVRLECADEWLLADSVPDGTFRARCVGRVQSWNADERQLVILPIAMFQ